MIGPDLIQSRTSHNIQYSISCSLSVSPYSLFIPRTPPPPPFSTTREDWREKRGQEINTEARAEAIHIPIFKSALSIFSHSLIVFLFLRGVGIKAGFGGNQTGLSRKNGRQTFNGGRTGRRAHTPNNCTSTFTMQPSLPGLQ